MICGKICVTKLEKEAHEMKEHGPTTHSCNKCDKLLKTQLELEEHIEREPSTVIIYLCTVCGKSFETQPELVSHSQKQHNPVTPMHAHCVTTCTTRKKNWKDILRKITPLRSHTHAMCALSTLKQKMSLIITWKPISPQSAHCVT